jgi:hypothetical protein
VRLSWLRAAYLAAIKGGELEIRVRFGREDKSITTLICHLDRSEAQWRDLRFFSITQFCAKKANGRSLFASARGVFE